MKNFQRGSTALISLIIIVVLVAIGGMYFVKTKTGSETSDNQAINQNADGGNGPGDNVSPENQVSTWKIYENDLNGLEIRYPSDWRECEKEEMFSNPTYLDVKGAVLGCVTNGKGSYLTFSDDPYLSEKYKTLTTLKNFFKENPAYEPTADAMPPYSVGEGKTNSGLEYIISPAEGYYFVLSEKVIRLGVYGKDEIVNREIKSAIPTFEFTK